MAFLTTGEFYEVTFYQSTNTAWGAMSPMPDIPSTVMSAIVAGATLVVYVIDSASGNVAFLGGQAFSLSDTLLATTSAALSKLTTTAEDGLTWTNAADSGGTWYMYDPQAGILREFSSGEKSALEGFLNSF